MTIKTDANQRFYAKIHKIAAKKRFPLRTMFELTYRCNFHCRHCYVPESFRKESEIKELKTKEVFSVLDQLKEAGCFYLGFTGGEPFVREDFLDILWYAKTSGFEIIVYTNASLIDERIAEELRRLKPNKVDITLNSLRRETFERVSRLANSYEQVLRAVELLYTRNIPLGFKSCLLKENEQDIENIVEYAQSHQALHRLITTLMPRLDSTKQPYQYQGKLKEEFLGCDIADYPKEISLSAHKNRIFKCGVGLHYLAINPYGELKMCVNINYPRYSILESPLKQCWGRLKEIVDNIKPDGSYKCQGCALSPYCEWCPAIAWHKNRTFTACVPAYRRRAEYLQKRAKKKIPLKLIENHDQAYYFWKKENLCARPLIHFDAHIDFGFPLAKPMKQTLEEVRTKKDLLQQLSINLMCSSLLNIKLDSLTDIGNYIYPAMRDGIVNDFYWVIPGTRKGFKRLVNRLEDILKSLFLRDPFKNKKIIEEEGMLKAKIYGRNFIITTFEDLPENITDAIVDVDVDFLTTDSIRKTDTNRNRGRSFPWLWPEEFVNQLRKKRIKPCCISIAYSVTGGFTPLIYKFLGDELAFFLNGASKEIIDYISNKNKALVFLEQGKLNQAIHILKNSLRDLPFLGLSNNLKNKLKAHIAFLLFRCFLDIGNLTKARFYYKIAINSDKAYRVKENSDGHLYLRRRGGLEKSEQEFKFILSADRDNTFALSGLANVFMKRKDFKKAKIFFQKAWVADRKNREALLGLGQHEILSKNYRMALKYFRDLKSKDRMQNIVYSLLSKAYEGLGRYDKALEEYRHALCFGMDLRLYLRFFRMLKRTAIAKKHREWIKNRIITYKNYRNDFLKLEENQTLGVNGRKNRIKKRLMGRIDNILYDLDETKQISL